MYVKSTTGGCDVVVMSEFCSFCFCFVGVGGLVRVVCAHPDLGARLSLCPSGWRRAKPWACHRAKLNVGGHEFGDPK